ncbi:MAG: hypothetical protein JJU33_02845 [Phycisphaerales bacterium]|nr:hypothetical protein [Phycisphaerales bacterium]
MAQGGAEEIRPIRSELLKTGARHDDDLMPAIQRLCEQDRVSPRDLGMVGVSAGPGGYTGLRVALTVAKCIADAAGARLRLVPSALSAAAGLEPAGPTLVCLASKRETVHATMVGVTDDWLADSAEALASLVGDAVAAGDPGSAWPGRWMEIGLIKADVVATLGPTRIVGDTHLPAPFREAAAVVGADVVLPLLGPEGVLRLMGCFPDADPAAAAPIYPREPEAVTRWRELGRGKG